MVCVSPEKLTCFRTSLLDQLPGDEEQPDDDGCTNNRKGGLHHVTSQESGNLGLEFRDGSGRGSSINRGVVTFREQEGRGKDSRESDKSLCA